MTAATRGLGRAQRARAALVNAGHDSLAGLATAVAAGLALAAYGAVSATRSLETDEAVSAGAAAGPLADVLERAFEQDPGQTLGRLVLALVGDLERAEWILRAPSAVAVVAAALCAGWAALTLAGRTAGLAAAATLALTSGALEVSQLARPYALALALGALSTALFVRAMNAGGAPAWMLYGAVAVASPLAHPLCIALVGVQAAALAADRSGARSRLAVAVTTVTVVVAGLMAAAGAVDRLAATDDGGLDARSLAIGLGAAAGWSPVAVGLAAWGLWRIGGSDVVDGRSHWRVILLGGSIVAPAGALLLAATVMPVFARHAVVLATPALAIAAGIGFAALGARHQLAAAGALVLTAVAAIAVTAARLPDQGWREAVAVTVAKRGATETVVVIPPRARAALTYYAPTQRLHDGARGDGAWVFVTGSPTLASRRARRVVATPRYALLEVLPAGDDLVLQHWVRP